MIYKELGPRGIQRFDEIMSPCSKVVDALTHVHAAINMQCLSSDIARLIRS